MADRNTELVVVLNDGETFSSVKGAKIVPVPNSGSDDEIVRYLKNGSYKSLPLGEVNNIETILDFFRLFFPDMKVEEEMDGNILIDTGVKSTPGQGCISLREAAIRAREELRSFIQTEDHASYDEAVYLLDHALEPEGGEE